MKVAQYVADWLADNTNGHCFGVCGGGRMWLDDAICHHPRLQFTATHHEQAAAFAAEAYARVSNRMASVHVTAGPGITNAMTGVACAYADSLPMMVIAGQVETRTIKSDQRQIGISEVDGAHLMGPITKLSLGIINPIDIRYFLERANYMANTGRKGPVYLEIPLDVQNAEIDPSKLAGFVPSPPRPDMLEEGVTACVEMLEAAQRPVVLVGNGVRLAGAEEELYKFLLNPIPVLCTWSGADLVATTNRHYIGRPGLIGDRAGNFAIQSADFILSIGARLSIPQIGHAYKLFAPKARIAMVDIDSREVSKGTLDIELPIVSDAKDFLTEINKREIKSDWFDWMKRCRARKKDHPVIQQKHAKATDGINVYHFLDELHRHASDSAVIVTDVGQSFVCTMQAMPQSGYRRTFHSPGIAPMGYGLPGAIGAATATNNQVICLTGDGGTMFNLQELQTIATNNLQIAIFVYVNGGYRTMQVTQGNHFGRESVSSDTSGVNWPDYTKIADAFGIRAVSVSDHKHLHRAIEFTLSRTPSMCIMHISPTMEIEPLVKSRMQDGKFVPVPLDEMHPPLRERVPA